MDTKDVRIHTRLACPMQHVQTGLHYLPGFVQVKQDGPDSEIDGRVKRFLPAIPGAMEGGAFTCIVFPPNQPDVCLRVSMLDTDACRGYHRMILSGALRGSMLPEVHCTLSYGGVFLSVMRRYKETAMVYVARGESLSVGVAMALLCSGNQRIHTCAGMLSGERKIIFERYIDDAATLHAAPVKKARRAESWLRKACAQYADQEWVAVLEELSAAGLGGLDIHDENIMLDESGKVFLTDPVSWRR